MKKVIIPIIIAALLWFLMFSPWTAPYINFWIAMAISGAILWFISIKWADNFKAQFSFNLKDIIIGLLSAAVLWGVFYVGEYLSSILFDFSKEQVGNIYQMKEGENKVFLALLLALVIGPAEEIFWRGYVQRNLIKWKGEWTAFFLTTFVYALVHIWSFNFMLIMAALVCGLFWGLIYRYNKNLVTLIISHAVWDVAVFLIFPIL